MVFITGLVALNAMLWQRYLAWSLDTDTASYAVAAYWWARGVPLYHEPIIPLPQGVIVIFRLIEAIGFGSVQGIRLAAMGYNVITAMVLFVVGKRLYGRVIAIAAATLFTLLMGLPYFQGTSANAELFMLLPLLGALYFLLGADEAPLGTYPNIWNLFFCGLLTAIALTIKQSALAGLAFAVLWVLLRYKTVYTTRRALRSAVVALVAGFIVGLLPAGIHGLVTAHKTYLNAILFYRLAKDSVSGTPVREQLARFATVSAYIVTRLPMVLIAIWAFVSAQGPTLRVGSRAQRFLALWLLTAFGGVAMGGAWWPHYFQQLAPPLAIAISVGYRAIIRSPRAARSTFTHALAVAFALLLVRSVGALLLLPNEHAQAALRRSQSVASYLRDHSGPTDQIYVAYQLPEIYYLAERRPSASRLDVRQLQRTPGAFAEQVARLSDPATAPLYIVGAQPFDDYGFDRDGTLRAVVARDYLLETTIDGTPLYRRRS